MAPRQPRKRIGVLCCAIALLIAFPASVWGWGSATHHYIAQNYSKHLPATMDGLRAYDSVVDAHVTDPDTRRPTTPGEEYRHYIDVDFYSEFLAGAMPHSRATLEATYGPQTVLTTGIVPWAVGEVVATLAQQFQAGQWSAAALTIADLCHYVGDVTQPLHCTLNYNGQQTGNTGIHSRHPDADRQRHRRDSVVRLLRLGERRTHALPGRAHHPIRGQRADDRGGVRRARHARRSSGGGRIRPGHGDVAAGARRRRGTLLRAAPAGCE